MNAALLVFAVFHAEAAHAWETPPPPDDLPLRGPSDFAHDLVFGIGPDRRLAARELRRAARVAARRAERSRGDRALEAQAELLDLRHDTAAAVLRSFETDPALRPITADTLGYLGDTAFLVVLDRVRAEETRSNVVARIDAAQQRIQKVP